MITDEEILALGFIKQNAFPSNKFTKLVKTRRLPLFYIQVEREPRGENLRVLRAGALVTVCETLAELKDTIWVLTLFERDSFAGK